ncbi:hypothetical protein COU01_02230 [Candidatus Falkowbacteria bacterium CG10_big_fil_rev_8_21_14_0_10_44_15]|uniref:DUF86 domain-containing protein n=1 Tax=Candidatus Falkowbacteria bacterium CG10_big_fil_rev_8_21_14_0_10_44_15 TaxID=1974569 RepID=A0A2H0UZV2_9BACT|nr:MAG: hypothetical protein COU01_02230 [Candidatus Falkowbacteria bacterium CG10_big_fil_rev_8_21_14_0_10_44_15]
MSKRGVRLYLEDIRNSLVRIEKYSRGLSFIKFKKDIKTIDAIVRNITIIGEATKNIPQNLRIAHPDIAWHKAMGMRNKVTHEYFGVDEAIL